MVFPTPILIQCAVRAVLFAIPQTTATATYPRGDTNTSRAVAWSLDGKRTLVCTNTRDRFQDQSESAIIELRVSGSLVATARLDGTATELNMAASDRCIVAGWRNDVRYDGSRSLSAWLWMCNGVGDVIANLTAHAMSAAAVTSSSRSVEPRVLYVSDAAQCAVMMCVNDDFPPREQVRVCCISLRDGALLFGGSLSNYLGLDGLDTDIAGVMVAAQDIESSSHFVAVAPIVGRNASRDYEFACIVVGDRGIPVWVKKYAVPCASSLSRSQLRNAVIGNRWVFPSAPHQFVVSKPEGDPDRFIIDVSMTPCIVSQVTAKMGH